MVIPPIKVPDLSTYIERQKKEIDGFKKEYQVTFLRSCSTKLGERALLNLSEENSMISATQIL